MADMRVRVRVYYFEDRRDDLVLDCVRPLLHQLMGSVDRAFFVRHWAGGPHIRICFKADPATQGDLLHTVDAALTAYLGEKPSRAAVDASNWLPRLEQVALAEGWRPERLRPDNSVVWEFGEPKTDHTDRVRSLIDLFYVATNDLAFGHIEASRQRRADRLLAAFDILTLTAHVGVGIERGFVSYRSHADAFLASSRDPQAARRSFDLVFDRHSTDLVERVRELVSRRASIGPDARQFLAWTDVVHEFRSRTRELVRLAPIPVSPISPPARVDPEVSPFHAIFAPDLAYRAKLSADPRAQAFRLLVNLQYLHLTRCGFTPLERWLLCHLVSRAVEAAFGVSAEAITQRWQRTFAVTGEIG
jgi:hypothetical protein